MKLLFSDLFCPAALFAAALAGIFLAAIILAITITGITIVFATAAFELTLVEEVVNSSCSACNGYDATDNGKNGF